MKNFLYNLGYTFNAIYNNIAFIKEDRFVIRSYSLKWEYFRKPIKIYKSEDSDEIWSKEMCGFRRCFYTGTVQIDCGINGWHDYKGDKLYVVGSATMIL